MIKEFKEFAFKGNLVDMAVGFILGAGFTTVVKSFVTNVVLPPIGLLWGINFKELKYVLKPGDEKTEVAIKYGQFIDDAIAFVLLAFVVFIIVKKVIAALNKEEEAPTVPAAPPKQEVLLEGILEELKKK